MKRLSMKDIAVAAGVARSTVSRALQGDRQIPAQTAERIRRLAEEMGYQRDPAYEVLAQARWGTGERFLNTVGFLVHADHHRQGYVEGARATAARLGYAVDELEMAEYASAARLDRVLQARGIRGLIVPTFTERYPMPALDWGRYAVVGCSVDAVRPPFPIVRTNVARKVEMAWERCREKGYRRVGFALPGEASNELDRRREATARQCLLAVPKAERVPVWCGGFDEVGELEKWVERHQPDAIIAGQPVVVAAIKKIAKAQGRRIPHCCLVELPGCAGVSSRPERLGAVAMSVLHQQLVENVTGPAEDAFTVVVEPGWVEGESLPNGAEGVVKPISWE